MVLYRLTVTSNPVCINCVVKITKISVFKKKSVKQLKLFLKERGITYQNLKKASIFELCEAAVYVGVEIDPDGLVEDRE